jgi:hypothetical protein
MGADMRHAILASVAATALLCGGCAYRGPLTRVAVDHNEMVANTANQLTLMNVLRAQKREPLHFTSISRLSGTASTVGTVGANAQVREQSSSLQILPAGFGNQTTVEGGEIATPSMSVAVTAGSSFDVAIFDTQEFYQGITGSVSGGTLAHYLHQGWPSELMTYLFVESVDLVATEDKGPFKKGDVVDTFYNDPQDKTRAAEFEQFAKCYQLTYRPTSVPDRQLVRLTDLPEVSLAELALLDGQKFEIDPATEKERWIRRKGGAADTLSLRSTAGQACVSSASTSTESAAATLQTSKRYSVQRLDPLPHLEAAGREDEHVFAKGAVTVDGVEVKVETRFVLRSISGVIYFLGEYARTGSYQYDVPGYAGAGTSKILTVQTSKPDDTFVAVGYRGARYYVPTENNRGAQVFALVQEMVNLQKNSKDKPSTQTVRVVN